MKTATGAVLVAGVLLFAAPALAQYYPTQAPPGPPPPPPPAYYPPPPPQYYPPPPPVYYPQQPVWDGKTHYTIRASGGISFASNGYYCGYIYTYYGAGYSCGAGFSAVWPDLNLDCDIWFRPNLGISLGANVMWGPYNPNFNNSNQIYSTTWEPHVDILIGLPGYGQVKGRVRFGAGLYIENTNANTGPTASNVTYNATGGAARVGIGASFLPKSLVGIGIDAIFEAGFIDNNYVSTVQLLVGPELHF